MFKKPVKTSGRSSKAKAKAEADQAILVHNAMVASRSMKSRTLVIPGRNQTTQTRFLIRNITNHLVSNVKKQAKMSLENDMQALVKLLDKEKCTQGVYFECVSEYENYLYMIMKGGPAIKFQVQNIHPIESGNAKGNCVEFSKPVLSFSNEFNDPKHPHRALIGRMLCRVFGCPMYDKKTVPLTDRVIHFGWKSGNLISFRHYEIRTFEMQGDDLNVDLEEIGPRFDLDPIRLLSAPVGGNLIWSNSSYKSPLTLRTQIQEQAEARSRTKKSRGGTLGDQGKDDWAKMKEWIKATRGQEDLSLSEEDDAVLSEEDIGEDGLRGFEGLELSSDLEGYRSYDESED